MDFFPKILGRLWVFINPSMEEIGSAVSTRLDLIPFHLMTAVLESSRQMGHCRSLLSTSLFRNED